MYRRKIKLYIIVFLILLTSMGLLSFAHKDNSIENPSLADIYPLNKNGQTYGPNIYDTNIMPELIATYGDDGVLGYIKLKDLIDEENAPRTPEEALEYQSKRTNQKRLPLYDKDGVNIVSYFSLGS